MRVEREDGGFVPRVEPAERVRRRLARVLQMPFHAAADVEEQRDADAGDVAAKIRDGARTSVLEDLEVAGGQVLDESTLVISDDGRNADQIDARSERRR